jgi:hypothetical protein
MFNGLFIKEIMDTSLVEGYIFLAEILYVFGEELQHILLAVIGLFAERLVRQRADAAVALQGTLAYLKQHTEVLVVEHPDTFHRVRGFAGRLQGEQQFVLTVEPFHQFLHPVLEIVSGKQFHTSCPPSFGFAATRAQSKVVEHGVNRFLLVPDRIVVQQPLYLGKAVTAFATHYYVLDTVFVPHALQGTDAHVQQLGGPGGVK